MKRRSQGFTIIEVMLSLTFGLFIIAACIEVYLAVKANYQMQQSLSAMQANGRLLTYIFQQVKSPTTLHGYTAAKPPAFLINQKPGSDILVAINKDQTAYYVSKNSLFVKTAGKPREELVAHIINMQIKYGIKCQQSDDICSYKLAPQVVNWDKVKSAEISLTLKDQKLQRTWSIYIAI